jgi:excisionase family DNA binding protein
MSKDERKPLTIPEVAKRLGISRTLAYEAARRGELPVIRIGKRVLVPAGALERLLEGRE